MKKKILSVALATIALAAVNLAEAQQGRIYRIGVLAQSGKTEERLEIKGLRAGLAEVGYVEGKNFS